MCLAEQALVQKYRVVVYMKMDGFQDWQVVCKRIWERIFNFKQ